MQSTRALMFAAVTCGIAVPALSAPLTDGLALERSPKTGLVTHLRAAHGGAIDLGATAGGVESAPAAFLQGYGHLFGVAAPQAELSLKRVFGDELANTHTVYEQVHRGVPVFGARLQVHQNALGAVVSANGQYFPLPNGLGTAPTLTAEQAIANARSTMETIDPNVDKSQLVIVDPGWYGDVPAGPHLAYHIVLESLADGVREAFFIDAHTGKILDRWDLTHRARNRRIINDLTGMVVRTEGGPPTGDFDADAAYDYAGDTYDYFFRAFDRDSIDDNGTMLIATVHLQSSSCPNAFGGTGGTSYCNGVVTDDIVAHEFVHGLTGFTADLIYQNQSGQLNESFSDVFGEVIDLLNGNAADAGTPGGTPWPTHGTGPGADTPNDLRSACVSNAFATVNSPGSIAGNYAAQPASFGPPLTAGGTTADIIVANPVRGCNADMPFVNAGQMSGKIVVVNRGDCTFTEKVKNAQNAGAIGVIVVNNVSSGLAPMGGSDGTITIRSVGVSQADGNLLKDTAQSATVNVTLRTNSNPHVRWLVGEDSAGFGGAIRDMWQPSCKGHPDNANHPFQTCSANDNGGVHSGSGVPNHAFAIVVDGKSYNGYSVSGIGLFKAAAVWYRALTVYLTPTSDFGDAFIAFNQAAQDLIGTMIKDPRDGSNFGIFTSNDALEIQNALLAVEMNTTGLCGANEVIDPTPPTLCEGRTTIYSNPINGGATAGWTTQVSGPSGPPTPYNWVIDSSLPVSRPGSAWFAEDRNIGNCGSQDESAVHTLFTTNIVIPGFAQSPTVKFSHFMSVEAGYDGGNVKMRVNGGAWQLIPASAFSYNRYNTTLVSSASGNTNPMAGEPAFSGVGGATNDWGTSLIDLTGLVSPGDTIQFRFDFGKDGCTGLDGWYVDDFEIFQCPLSDCNANGIPDATDIANSTSADCDANGVPDECQIEAGSPAPGGPFFCTSECDPDCNVNGIPDTCETTGNDCNKNNLPDSCELSACSGDPACADCNQNGLLDSCDLNACAGEPGCSDCDGNGVLDSCDIAGGAADSNSNGVPDSCELPAVVPDGVGKVRFISFTVPSPQAGSSETAIRVRFTTLYLVIPIPPGGPVGPWVAFEGMWMWVGPPTSYVESSSSGIPFQASRLQCTPHYQDWSTVGLLHVTGPAIVPSSVYAVEQFAASCAGSEVSCTAVSSAVSIATNRWGDVESPFNPPSPTTQPDLADVGALVNKFRGAVGAPIKARAVIAAEDTFGTISPVTLAVDLGFTHIASCVDAFRGAIYPGRMGRCATGGGACRDNLDCSGPNAPPCELYCP